MSKKPDFLKQLRAAEAAEAEAPATRPVGQGKHAPQRSAGQAGRTTTRGRYRKHGQYYQVTFRLPGEYVDAIEGIAGLYPSLSKADVKRWLLGQGIKAFLDGAAKPTTATEISEKIELPALERGKPEVGK